MLVGMGREREGEGGTTLSLFLSGAKDYGQDHKSCTSTANLGNVLIRPSGFPLSPPLRRDPTQNRWRLDSGMGIFGMSWGVNVIDHF